MKKLSWVSILFSFIFLSCVSNVSESDVATEYFNVGNAFYELKQYSKAEEYYVKVLKIDPKYHKARFNLIYSLVAQEKYKEASNNIDFLKKEDEFNLKIKELDAYLLYVKGDLLSSLNVYNELYKSGDTSKDIVFNIVKLNYQLQHYEVALVYLSELLNEYDDILFYEVASKVARDYGDKELASKYYEGYIEAGGKDLLMLHDLSIIYGDLKDYKNQGRILNLIIDNDDGKNKELKGSTYFELGKIELLVNNDFKNGYDYLVNAIDFNFSNEIEIDSLLENPNLIEVEKIRELFNKE